ncbi:Spore germination protein GerE [Candidatus Methylomirabilis lanthanidiphila]|uniref:Spore germination protein GerE n=1 Tax=Candidatus Methylomirabilis lanthanidiphila TaxID=2211376 RepID=A0A564ZJW6_9BACT|nr:PAS and helix-turn-helix domain-containing protein [Candidatus Methylomirabilis lanthanidiphila]VUZ84838.1 Spore germination protein GerE [Candidatus Methylomirabilis lanthanidiphila]
MYNPLEFLSNTADGVLAVDQEQRIVFWNKAAERLLGFQAKEMLGRFCHDVIGGCDESGQQLCKSGCLQQLRDATPGGVADRNILVATKTSQQVWLNVSTVLVPSSRRHLCALVHLFRDVTAQKEPTHSIQQVVDALSKLSATQATARPVNDARRSTSSDLTRREKEILRLIASGHTTKAIAQALYISPATVRNHIHSVLTKLGARHRLEAVLLAASHHTL